MIFWVFLLHVMRQLNGCEWKVLVTSFQFLYTDEMILHQGTDFHERSYTLQMTNYGTQLVQKMSEIS
jgi:hypothetical protein